MKSFVLICFMMFLSLKVFGGGYERANQWSAKWSALGGAAVGAVQGADSLFFNPAGLVEGNINEVSANFSPALSKVAGPVFRDDQSVDGENVFGPVFGVLGKYSLSSKWAIGFGVYSAAGVVQEFDPIDFTGFNSELDTLKPHLRAMVGVLEFGLGGAYKINKNWNVGAIYRISLVQGEFTSASLSPYAAPINLLHVKLEDLEDWNFKGFRLGVQYISDDKTFGVGAAVRNELAFDAEGNASGEMELTLGGDKDALVGGGSVNVQSHLPWLLSIGGFKHFKKFGLYGEYAWANYSRNKELKISDDGKLKTTAAVGSLPVLANLPLRTRDMHMVKLGGQYNWSWPLRLGYTYASATTNDERSSVLFTPPGKVHSLNIGTGKMWKQKYQFDVGLEYGWYPSVRGRSIAPTLSNDAPRVEGVFKADYFVAHTSVKIPF